MLKDFLISEINHSSDCDKVASRKLSFPSFTVEILAVTKDYVCYLCLWLLLFPVSKLEVNLVCVLDLHRPGAHFLGIQLSYIAAAYSR